MGLRRIGTIFLIASRSLSMHTVSAATILKIVRVVEYLYGELFFYSAICINFIIKRPKGCKAKNMQSFLKLYGGFLQMIYFTNSLAFSKQMSSICLVAVQHEHLDSLNKSLSCLLYHLTV